MTGAALHGPHAPELPLVLDGGLAPELERRGADIAHPLWSAKALFDAPRLIESIHRDYLDAGADILITASYQATFAGFAARGFDADTTRKALRNSVVLAMNARSRWRESAEPGVARSPRVAASIGAFGAHRHDRSEYHGNYRVSHRTLFEFHRRQFEVLIETDADLIAFETIPSLAEGEAIVRLLQEFSGVPAWIAFSCRDGEHVCHGERFRDCVALANEHADIRAIGLNCTDPRFAESLLEQAVGMTDKPLLVYPNAGDRGDEKKERVDFGAMARRWLDSGARWIGGCCGTTPEDIRRVAAVVHGDPDWPYGPAQR
jgi:homocysteine S-methyltransferase